MSSCFIGLMSGTSLDGLDGVLIDFAAAAPKLLAHAQLPFDTALRSELLALNSRGDNELHRAAVASQRLVRLYAQLVQLLLARSPGIAAADIVAIGAHGQTVRHQPGTEFGYSWQLNAPALLAELTHITVVADFRSRDVAAGGQGAPLVPAFHRQIFGRPGSTVAVLNIGGMANLTVLPADPKAPLLGFDCGPGNALIDAWCSQHSGQLFDAGGAWAASGRCLPPLLALLRSEPFFALPPPKSTGRDLFNQAWLQSRLAAFASASGPDIQATLTELSASVCCDAVKNYAPDARLLLVCGGGAYNTYLMQRLQAGLPAVLLARSDAYGMPALQVEAAAFAWLARQAVLRQSGNVPSVTGAAGPRILGAIYPA